MKRTSKFRFLTMCLTLVLLVSSFSSSTAIIANAATLDKESLIVGESKIDTLTPIEETNVTQEQALEILGLTAEEAESEGMSFYVVDAQPASAPIETPTNATNLITPGISTNQVSISPGQNYVFPTFTFSGTNYGQYWTCKGTRMMWGAVYHSASDPNAAISIYLYRYGQDYTLPNDYVDCVLFLPVGQSHKPTRFFDAYKTDYKFVYYYGKNSKVTMLVGVAGQ